jgi:protein-S-isoprenylcysteine O-methyltransferase Ste14
VRLLQLAGLEFPLLLYRSSRRRSLPTLLGQHVADILVGIYFEERDLIAPFGERYRRYREGVGMLVPKPNRAPVEEFDATAK